MAFLEARRHKDSGDEQHPSLLVAHSPLGSTLADGAAHDAKSLPDRWRRAAGKTLSAALFVSMWVVPPLIHRAGFRAKVGSAYHVHKDLLALYSGRLTLANATFLLLYTAWLQWTPRIVDHCRTIVECVLLLERILLLECVLYRHGYNGLRV